MPFVHRVTARFFDVDRAGIMFFGRVFEMCHVAYEEMLLAMGLGVDVLFEVHGIGSPVVHAEADFARPIRMHDRIDVELAVERMGNGSVSLAFTLRGSDGVVRATARVVHAFVTLVDFRPTIAPLVFVDGLRSLGLLEPAAG